MSTTVTYKDKVIFTVENETKRLNTAGKWLEGNIYLSDVSGSSGATVIIGTTEEWDEDPLIIAETNVIYVYSDYMRTQSGAPIPAYKVGDGESYLCDLPFSSESAGGGGDYERLENKPKIESVTLIGNKNFGDLGLSAIASDDLIEILV